MKKILSILLATLLLCALFAGCSSTPKDNAPVGGGAAATDTDTVAVGAVVIARDDIPEMVTAPWLLPENQKNKQKIAVFDQKLRFFAILEKDVDSPCFFYKNLKRGSK